MTTPVPGTPGARTRAPEPERLNQALEPVRVGSTTNMVLQSGSSRPGAEPHPATSYTARIGLFAPNMPFRRTSIRPRPTLTKRGRSLISRAKCPRPDLTLEARFGPERVHLGRAGIGGHISFIYQANCAPRFHWQASCQRRTTREADLPTQQTGAQAPPWLPCPHRHHRRPEGSGRAARARPQASERLGARAGLPGEILSWIG